MNRIKEIEQRLSQIAQELDNDTANVDALEEEVRSLQEERAALLAAAEKRKELRSQVAQGMGTVVREFPEERTVTAAGVDSAEYRTAFFKSISGKELTPEERAAFVATTTNTGAPLPTSTLNRVWSLVTEKHSILHDVNVQHTGVVIEVPIHKATTQGKAKKVGENEANDDMKFTTDKITLSGHDFSASVDLTYAMQRMSISALEDYLVSLIGDELGNAMSADVISTIITKVAVGNQTETATVGKITYEELTAAFGKLKRTGSVKAYMNRTTQFNYLISMTDSNKRPLFQPNLQAGAEMNLLGGVIRIDDAVEDGKILIGDPKKVLFNVVQDIMIENDRDIKKHVVTHSGYARAEAALLDEEAFSLLTVKAE